MRRKLIKIWAKNWAKFETKAESKSEQKIERNLKRKLIKIWAENWARFETRVDQNLNKKLIENWAKIWQKLSKNWTKIERNLSKSSKNWMKFCQKLILNINLLCEKITSNKLIFVFILFVDSINVFDWSFFNAISRSYMFCEMQTLSRVYSLHRHDTFLFDDRSWRLNFIWITSIKTDVIAHFSKYCELNASWFRIDLSTAIEKK